MTGLRPSDMTMIEEDGSLHYLVKPMTIEEITEVQSLSRISSRERKYNGIQKIVVCLLDWKQRIFKKLRF